MKNIQHPGVMHGGGSLQLPDYTELLRTSRIEKGYQRTRNNNEIVCGIE